MAFLSVRVTKILSSNGLFVMSLALYNVDSGSNRLLVKQVYQIVYTVVVMDSL